MVVLEPSCCSVFRDELTELFPSLPRAQKLKKNTFTISEFLDRQTDFAVPPLKRKAMIHGHCHHKAVMRMKGEEALYKKMGLDYQFLDSGCCGMAGSFGFEEGKYDVSVNVGERVLLPAVRRADPRTLIVADGFSCKEQIQQLTDREALHTAEVLSLAMRNPDVSNGDYPEHQMVGPRKAAQKRAMMKAGLLAAGVLAGLLFAICRNK